MGRTLGVDLGERRIGLAIASGAAAVPHDTLERGDDPARDRAAILAAGRAAGCDTVVIGVPRSLDGGAGPAAKAVLAEVSALRADVLRTNGADLEIVTHDERFTTVIAQQRLRDAGVAGRRQRSRVDASAAAVMLQSFLERAS